MLWLALAFGCEEPSRSSDLTLALDDARVGFAEADLDAFGAARDRARALLPCLGEPLPPALAADLHRMEGLAAFFAEEAERAPQAFASARRLEPSFRFDESLVPAGNPILDAYFGADPFAPAAVAVPLPSDGSLRLDGQRASARPLSGPTVFQLLDGAGSVAGTNYLWPEDPLPAYVVAAAPEEPTPKRSLKRPLAYGAAGAAVLGGLLYGANAVVHQQYDRADSVAALDRARGLNNGLAVGSGVALTAGVGLGVGALLVR